MFMRPSSDDESEKPRVVKAKPISSKIARKLGDQHRSKDFVSATDTQKDFQSGFEVVEDDGGRSEPSGSCTVEAVLSSDELNKLSAKILKAEMLGDTATVARLTRELANAHTSVSSSGGSVIEKPRKEPREHEVLLTRTDHRTGLSMPISRSREDDSAGTRKKMKVDLDRDAHLTVQELIKQEHSTTAEDQIAMFGAMSAKAATSQKLDDDWTVDDVFMSKKKSVKMQTKEKVRDRSEAVAEYKRHEETLENCTMCINSRRFQNHLVIATGLKTYLMVPPIQSLVENHCFIVPAMHVASTLQLDEDVYDEMKIWRKGLVAMFDDMEEDCVFVETAKNIAHQRHMCIECIPLPKEVGETAPIYFKKAILECDEEWAQNKRLIDLSQKNIRRAIPRGFSYFAVDFGLQPGFAHVIENESLFPGNFAREIIGGMLDLHHNLWRKPAKETFEEQTAKRQKLKDAWTPYDWTEKVKAATRAQS